MNGNTITQELVPQVGTALTKHARKRMNARGFSEMAISSALLYGRIIRTRGAEIYAIGRKEVKKCLAEGIDLSSFEGIQVVCKPDGTVLTAYRNRDFRGLHPEGHCHARRAVQRDAGVTHNAGLV